MRTTLKIILLGIGATFLTDVWAILLRLFGIKSSGLLIVGSWTSTNLFNTELGTSQSWVLGWTIHYIIGILFVFLFIFIYKKWFYNPKFKKAIVFGLITVAFPLFIAWPIMGFGFAFSKTPIQTTLIAKAITLHLIYGIGLYLTTIAMRRINLSNH